MSQTPRRRPGTSRRSGFGLADFVAGTFVFTGALVGFTTMTNTKFDALGRSSQRAQALAAAEAAADRVRVQGLPGAPRGEADLEGFRSVAVFAPKVPLPRVEGSIDARWLRVEGGAGQGLYEARVRVRWRERADLDAWTSITVPVVTSGPAAEGGR